MLICGDCGHMLEDNEHVPVDKDYKVDAAGDRTHSGHCSECLECLNLLNDEMAVMAAARSST